MFKITKNVWRNKELKADEHIRDERHRNSLATPGVIVEYRNEVLFFPLNNEEEKQFDKAISMIGIGDDSTFRHKILEGFDNENIYEYEDRYTYCVQDGNKISSFERFGETNNVYFWTGNAYNAVVWENNGHWICFDEKFDDIDLYQDNIFDIIKSYITEEKFASTFTDMFDQFSQDNSGSSPVCGFDFENDFPADEVELIKTITE